jgi:hypothetical protein
LIAFGLILASIAVGLTMRHWVPEAHISGDSKDVIRLATALIGTMAAVVLALLFSSTRTSFETTNASVGRMTTSVVELDHMLGAIWQDDATIQHPAHPDAPEGQVTVLTKLRQMTPATPLQAALLVRALSVSGDLEQIRLSLLAQPTDSLSKPFVTVLVLWLCFIFLSFSMSAKANTTLVVILVICAFSASSAIYLILELEQPFDGLMQIPNAALRSALPPLS